MTSSDAISAPAKIPHCPLHLRFRHKNGSCAAGEDFHLASRSDSAHDQSFVAKAQVALAPRQVPLAWNFSELSEKVPSVEPLHLLRRMILIDQPTAASRHKLGSRSRIRPASGQQQVT
jgi:hypothetical protein